jgi:hypothetical protein
MRDTTLTIDPSYVYWLKMHHPDALPADRYDLTSAGEAQVDLSMASYIETVSPLCPVVASTLAASSGTSSVVASTPAATSKTTSRF